jgi:hypothetical protein
MVEQPLYITPEDRLVLRELAKKQLEYSQLPIMHERAQLWYKHNDLKGERPMVYIEMWTFWDDIAPSFECQTETGRIIEKGFYNNILNHELIGDDKVVPPYYPIGWDVWFQLFGVTIETEHVNDAHGRNVGHRFKYIIDDLKRDFPKLGPSKYGADRENTLAWKEFLENIFGDILPVKLIMGGLGASLTQQIVHMMGMEKMLLAMYDYPDTFHALMGRIADDYISYFKWLEAENLLLPTTAYEGVAQGTFAFTNDLPSSCPRGRTLTTRDVWGYMDSQETVGISPDMYGEFIFPYYKRIADQYGLLSYGCCEPVHPIWDDYVSKFSRLRKVSISPWCDEEFMGERLRGNKVIYQRKPSPTFIGTGKDLDEDAFRDHILKTLKAAQGCYLEITQRDVYMLGGNIEKPRRAVQIIREMIDRYWK